MSKVLDTSNDTTGLVVNEMLSPKSISKATSNPDYLLRIATSVGAKKRLLFLFSYFFGAVLLLICNSIGNVLASKYG
jgi:hypothetical protein